MIYRGNVPSNVNKDAKYSVVNSPRCGGMEIRLIYRLGRGERALVTTSAHPQLVDMVNAVKIEMCGVSGGAFYVNEFGHVLVPAQDECHYAGNYGQYLEFDFEGTRIGPQAPPNIGAGDMWPGPRVGIAYTLSADSTDIRYQARVRPQVFRDTRLSDEVGAAAASRLARRIGRVKPGGGRIYINEAREFFAPIQRDGEWVHIYLGNLNGDEWFNAAKTM